MLKIPELQSPLSTGVLAPVMDRHEGPVPQAFIAAVTHPGGQELGRGAEGGEERQTDVPAAGRLEADLSLDVLHAAHTRAADGKSDVLGKALSNRPGDDIKSNKIDFRRLLLTHDDTDIILNFLNSTVTALTRC